MLTQIRQFTKEHRLGTSIASTIIMVLILYIPDLSLDLFQISSRALGILAPSILIYLTDKVKENRESFTKLILIYNIAFAGILFIVFLIANKEFNEFFSEFILAFGIFYIVYYFLAFRK